MILSAPAIIAEVGPYILLRAHHPIKAFHCFVKLLLPQTTAEVAHRATLFSPPPTNVSLPTTELFHPHPIKELLPSGEA